MTKSRLMPSVRCLRFLGAAAVALVAFGAGCRSSSDKTVAEPEPSSGEPVVVAVPSPDPVKPPQTPPAAATSPTTAPKVTSTVSFDCEAGPPAIVCCEALTPTCNECRDKGAKALEVWHGRCDKKVELPAECGEKVPSVACCPESSSECNACRAEALNKLLARRAKCGEPPTP
jgi:hypothetical protein